EAHQHEIVHRDVKSANVLITHAGDAKILDFGIAALVGETKMTTAGVDFGTAAYMSPEQLKGEPVDHRTDIWALGVVLYEMLTGSLPFSSKFQPGVVYAILHEEPVPVNTANPAVPDDVAAVVQKALANKVEARYQRMSDMVADLAAAIGEGKIAGIGELISRSLRVKRVRRAIVAVGAGAVALLGAFIIWQTFSPADLASPPSSIAVMSCENQTGDTSYNKLRRIIPNLLITKLQTLKGLEVTTWSRLRDLAKQAGAEDVETIDRDLGFQLCQMDGVEAIALPSVSKLGDILVTYVEVVEVESKRHIASASAKGEGDESILGHQIDDLGRQISEAMGLSLNQSSTLHESLTDVTTNSMEAYELYLRGVEARLRFDFIGARVLLEKAVRLDTTFAYAYFELSKTLGGLALYRLSNEALAVAYRFSHKTTDLERRYIKAEWVRWKGGPTKIFKSIVRDYPKEKHVLYLLAKTFAATDAEQAIGYLKRALELDPNYVFALNLLGYLYMRIGEFERARECFERYASILPDNPNVYDCMGELYFRMGKLDMAVAEYKKTTDMDPNFFYSWTGLAYISAVREDYGTALGYAERMIANAPSPAIAARGYHLRAFFFHWLGRSREALEDLQTAERLNLDTGGIWLTTRDRVLRAMIFHDLGDFARSRTEFNAPGTLGQDHERCTDYSSGIVLVGQGLSDLNEGDIGSARVKLTMLDSLLGLPICMRAHLSFVRNSFLAEILIREKRFGECISHCDTVKVPRIFKLAPGNTFLYNFPFLVDQRARALEARGLINEAIAEYRRLLTFDPESDSRRLIHPLYHYRLGRLCERAGMGSVARNEYEAFLRLWDKADPDKPEPEDARKRMARLPVSSK
ncbi:MAG: tetratricopeptide repeat protein, partial [Bacteroidota bacterium]